MAVAWQSSISVGRSEQTYSSYVDTSQNNFQSSQEVAYQSTLHNSESYLRFQKLKQNLIESRKAFLNIREAPSDSSSSEETKQDNVLESKKGPSKKISFKVKKSSSLYRRNPPQVQKLTTTISVSKVAELTKKFNLLVAENSALLVEPKFRKLVKRVNSQRGDSDYVKVTRSSSVKNKVKEYGVKVMRKSSVKKKMDDEQDKSQNFVESVVNCDNNRTRSSDCKFKNSSDDEDTEIKSEKQNLARPNTLSCEASHSYFTGFQISPTSGAVRATIEIFEKKTSLSSDSPVLNLKPKLPAKANSLPKPKVPEKKFNLKTRAITVRNFDSKIIKHISTPLKTVEETDHLNNTNDNSKEISNKDNKERIPEDIETQQNLNEKCPEIVITTDTKTDVEEDVPIVNIPITLPTLKCDSSYETINLKTDNPSKQVLRIDDQQDIMRFSMVDSNVTEIKPNASFLWSLNQDKSPTNSEKLPCCFQSSNNIDVSNKEPSPQLEDALYDLVIPNDADQSFSINNAPDVPPKPGNLKPTPPSLPPKTTKNSLYQEEKIYEELENVHQQEDSGYEYCESPAKYEDVESKLDDGYEYCASPKEENIYETLPCPPLLPKRQQEEPLPPRPPSRSSYCTIKGSEVSNCYESVYNVESVFKHEDTESNYESIYGCQIKVSSSNRDSLASSDQQSNSLYGRYFNGLDENAYSGKATSDLSSSDRSDDWIDMSDGEDRTNSSEIVIVREKQKNKKPLGWAQQCREQFIKSPLKQQNNSGLDTDSDHHYETLSAANEEPQDDDYDSFDSDSESDASFSKLNDSGLDIANNQLPDPPNSVYVLTKLRATAGKHMRKLRRNWSLTKSDISRSLSRMTKKKSRTDLETTGVTKSEDKYKEDKMASTTNKSRISSSEAINIRTTPSAEQTQLTNIPYQQIDPTSIADQNEMSNEKSKSFSGFFSKFRRSMSLSAESTNELGISGDSKPKSTFYLTETINLDTNDDTSPDSGVSLSPPTIRHSKSSITRPQSPPPPIPASADLKKSSKKDKRTTSWYAEVGLFKNSENIINTNLQTVQKKPSPSNTCWYAEVGLYQTQTSTPCTSSAENSGDTSSIHVDKSSDFINQDSSEEYYNLKNESDHCNNSIKSCSSTETKKNSLSENTPGDIQLRLQDEPLYQFYDAAVLEYVCKDGISDTDSDGYEEVGRNNELGSPRISLRPSTMDLVCPKRNSIAFTKTLWCEIPEVIQSSVLSTLSLHQKKIQEAKFEMITSEASYLNSLNVLNDHFITTLKTWDLITQNEFETLFGRVAAVKECSEKLFSDMEKCWQDNILLNGVCDIVQKHAEENFYVYVSYCENQILLDDTLKNIKERQNIYEQLRKLETSGACQSLSLYSFLLLPMQRITRWPLLVDAVLKRLSPQDKEYLTCQYALATLNKIVNQCNEAARKKEREIEMKRISSQIEFSKGVPPVNIISSERWLVRSGAVINMSSRNEDTKLTFGKRFTKTPLHLFLFNDIFFVTKPKSDNWYSVIHYCPRNLVEINTNEMMASLPAKDSQGKNLLFLTILENQDEKTVELILSCNSETDKERWIEAFTPPKAEDPDETVYECWDCPQVTAIHSYTANQPDELGLSRGDVINVLRKMTDGWYHGERIRDGQTGWFPANYSVEVANPHVRARNLKQRYRLLAFSESYLKSKS